MVAHIDTNNQSKNKAKTTTLTGMSGALSQLYSGSSLEVPNMILSPPFSRVDVMGESACN